MAKIDPGRPLSTLEESLFDLAYADAEMLNGGFPKEAIKLYNDVLKRLKSSTTSFGEYNSLLLQSHCHNGLAQARRRNLNSAPGVAR